jgi:4-cresol dehydrogenase (hydroxylating)
MVETMVRAVSTVAHNMLRAVSAWRQTIGSEHVVTDPAVLARAETATFATSAKVIAVLRPADADETAACLRVAHAEGLAVHPVSRGLNWGFGSRVPPTSGAVLVDLARMDAIVAFDEERAVVTLQPGVTFSQLDAFLREQGSRCFMPAIGGSGHASVVGNAIQRGHGIGPAPRRIDAVGAVEGLLLDGTPVAAGYPRQTAFHGAEAHRHGVGPSLAGLFFQSDLTVVTCMTLTLERRPAQLRLFSGRIGGGEALAELLERLRPLLLDGALGRSLFTVWNTYKYVAARSRYPWSAMNGAVPLDLPVLGTQPEWLFSGALYAPTAAHAAATTDALMGLGDVLAALRILDPGSDEAIHAAPTFLGTPSGRNLSSIYWRKPGRLAGSPAPERDRCGILHLCPLLPMGHEAAEVLRRIEAQVLAHGFEPQIGFDCADARTIEVFVTIAYDRDRGDDEPALACHDAVLRELEAAGFPPYRLGVQSADRSRRTGPIGDELVKLLSPGSR